MRFRNQYSLVRTYLQRLNRCMFTACFTDSLLIQNTVLHRRFVCNSRRKPFYRRLNYRLLFIFNFIIIIIYVEKLRTLFDAKRQVI